MVILNGVKCVFNSDFYGMYHLICKHIWGGEGVKYGLILGAGATAQTACFVLIHLNIIPLIYNRSK